MPVSKIYTVWDEFRNWLNISLNILIVKAGQKCEENVVTHVQHPKVKRKWKLHVFPSDFDLQDVNEEFRNQGNIKYKCV